MFCSKCGKEIPDGSAFCGGCGAAVGASSPSEGPSPEAAAPSAQGSATEVAAAATAVPSAPSAGGGEQHLSPKTGLNQTMIIGIAAAVVAVIAIVIGINLFSGSGGSVKNAINVVDVLTCDQDKAYSTLSSMDSISYSDVLADAPIESDINFVSSPQVVELAEMSWVANDEGRDLSNDSSYAALAKKVFGKPYYVCRFHGTYGQSVNRGNFEQGSMPELIGSYFDLYIPGDEELDCEAIATYLQPFIPYEQCYVVQTDNDYYEGGAKGSGCVSNISVYKSEDYTTGIEYWDICVSTESTSRVSEGNQTISEFDYKYSSIDSANYLDTYIV